MPSTSSYGLSYFINLIIWCFLYNSLYRGYTYLELVCFDLLNRRGLIVGTLFKFLSKTMVLTLSGICNEAYVQPTTWNKEVMEEELVHLKSDGGSYTVVHLITLVFQ